MSIITDSAKRYESILRVKWGRKLDRRSRFIFVRVCRDERDTLTSGCQDAHNVLKRNDSISQLTASNWSSQSLTSDCNNLFPWVRNHYKSQYLTNQTHASRVLVSKAVETYLLHNKVITCQVRKTRRRIRRKNKRLIKISSKRCKDEKTNM